MFDLAALLSKVQFAHLCFLSALILFLVDYFFLLAVFFAFRFFATRWSFSFSVFYMLILFRCALNHASSVLWLLQAQLCPLLC